MKYLLTWLLGLATGAALAVALLWFNPLADRDGPQAGRDALALGYHFPAPDALLLTHGGRIRLPVRPDSAPALWENTIRRTLVHAHVLYREDGAPYALASRVTAQSSDTDLLRRGLLLDDRWLVTVPGEGSMLIDARSNIWPLVRDHLLPVWYLSRDWQGPATVRPTSGPGLGSSAVVQGLSGRFAGRAGSATESWSINGLGADARSTSIEATLHLRLLEPFDD
jgi:hypothetical protein